ncbi:TetR/AcrR family transcriptional regulator [Pelomonas sp. APW6]|uniref:TetR/AcrR family transcriptional regulator n=1 Tax=Roseateles subflavus TaxID=3053353 RepID=A0ABT7LK83_9BURK|nr:TetR/AcrR family transcriptional regulator [Pelomonas sp. APW6]MDL5033276.1 TetR/AcrR family transcriptional regulator [Pelomonas sp. APW6]
MSTRQPSTRPALPGSSHGPASPAPAAGAKASAASAASSAPPKPARLPAPRQRRKEARPQELLAAALELFVEKGFAAARSEEVAQRAGVSKGTLYLYYPSKEELFKAMVRESLSSRIAEAGVLIAQFEGPTPELLHRVMHLWWTEVGMSPAGGITKIMMAEARNFPELASFFHEEVIAPTQALLAQVIQRGVDRGEFRPVHPAMTVQVLIGPMLHMVLFQHSFGACALHLPCENPADVLALELDLLLHGLCPRTPPGG